MCVADLNAAPARRAVEEGKRVDVTVETRHERAQLAVGIEKMAVGEGGLGRQAVCGPALVEGGHCELVAFARLCGGPDDLDEAGARNRPQRGHVPPAASEPPEGARREIRLRRRAFERRAHAVDRKLDPLPPGIPGRGPAQLRKRGERTPGRLRPGGDEDLRETGRRPDLGRRRVRPHGGGRLAGRRRLGLSLPARAGAEREGGDEHGHETGRHDEFLPGPNPLGTCREADGGARRTPPTLRASNERGLA